MKPGTAIAAAIAFLGVLASFVVLVLTGHADQAPALASIVVTVAGLLGLGSHVEKRTQEQNETIAKIDKQTNGVLDKRIHDGTTAAVKQLLQEHNIIPADEPHE